MSDTSGLYLTTDCDRDILIKKLLIVFIIHVF